MPRGGTPSPSTWLHITGKGGRVVARFGQFKAFNAVARAGGFAHAARRLGISEPALIAQVRGLEKDHGAVLFEPTVTGVQLTSLGRRLFRVTQALDDLEETADVLLGGGGDPVPRVLRLATASPQVFMPLVAAFTRAHPEVELDIAVGSTGDAMRRLLDREVDMALTPIIRHDDRLDHMPFLRNSLAVLAPADHPLAVRESVSITEIVAEPLIMRLGLSTTQKVTDQALAMHGLRPRPLLRLETREAVHEAVANGLGLALVLDRDVPPDPRHRLLPLLDCDVGTNESVVWLRSRSSADLIHDFLVVADTLREHTGGPACAPAAHAVFAY